MGEKSTLSKLKPSFLVDFRYAIVGGVLAMTITFVGSTMLLLFHSIPLEKSEQVPNAWFDTVYYLLLSATALIGGLLVTIVLMLYHTVSDMIKTLGPGDSDALLVSQEEKQEA